MQQNTPSASIKTSHLKEVPFYQPARRKFPCRSFIPRIICELSSVFLVFTLVLLFIFSWPQSRNFIENIVTSKTVLAPNTDGFEIWLNPPVKTLRSYRLFDVTNSIDVMTKQNTPELQIRETLPLTYELKVRKNDVRWSEDGESLQYSLERIFTRDGEFDEMSLNQHGHFVDVLRAMFRTKFARVADDTFYALGGNNAFNYSKAVDKIEGFMSPVFAAISARMEGPNRDRYGFIYRYNGSNGFNVTIHSGSKNPFIKGKFINFSSEYTSFKADAKQFQADLFDGLTYPKLGNPPNRLVINLFQPDFCRPVQLRYNQTISMLGIPTVHEYILKLIDSEKCPEMDENCPEVDRLDVTRCFSNELPANTLILTKPHVYGHNSMWTNVMFEPDAEKHESAVYFEPISGTPILARSRIQLNVDAWIDRIKVKDDGNTETTKSRGFQRFIPMMWIDQVVTLNENKLKSLKLVTNLLEFGQRQHDSFLWGYFVAALFTTVLIIALIELACWKRKRSRQSECFSQSTSDQLKALLSQTQNLSPMSA